MASILGKKIGMTNIFDNEGRFVPVTVIEAGPSVVLGTRTKDKEGYTAMVLGYEDKKESKVKKPEAGWFKKIGISPKKTVKEVRLFTNPECKTGEVISVNLFKAGDFIDVTGTSIGKGFQGGMKRWHWSGGEKGHGSMFHRAPGSIGASSYPSQVHKGKTLPGHMGNVKKTIQNLEIMEVDEAKNLIAVKGGVPGHKGNILFIRHAKKIKISESQKEQKLKGKDEGSKQ